jgi:hypothetical protein
VESVGGKSREAWCGAIAEELLNVFNSQPAHFLN